MGVKEKIKNMAKSKGCQVEGGISPAARINAGGTHSYTAFCSSRFHHTRVTVL